MKNLNNLRKQIEIIDIDIIRLLKKRFLIAKKIGKIKIDTNGTIKDKEREKQIIKRLIDKNKNINKEFICRLYKIIFKYSINLQKKSK
ncbi:MAG: chorismate mutase [Nanoarchaeota archaeon]|nr:chorismate mutase [Nanoarchaeota archaeon]